MATKAEEQHVEDEELAALGRERLPEPEEVDQRHGQLRREHERDDHGDRVEDVADHPLREAREDATGEHGDDRQVDPGQL